jgi:RimJ/RimL family protein N-acetyltransferase
MAVPTEDLVTYGIKVALHEKSPDDTWNDYLWRIDEELSELDAARPLTMPYEQFLPIHKEEIRYPAPRSHRFAIMTLEDGTHIGNCMYYDLDLRRREAELGIMVGDRAYWNGGYGTEATGLLVDHLFEELELERVYLKTLEWNIRAQNSFIKSGFRQYGWGNQGRYRFMLMEIKLPEWDALRRDQSQTQ